jgi:hypothetical protein
MRAAVFQSRIDKKIRGVAAMQKFARVMTFVTMVPLAALPETAASFYAGTGHWRLSQEDQSAVGAAGDLEQPVPTITDDGTPATVIDDREVEGILGKNVRSNAGEDMGQIVDVIVKRDGQVRAAVIDFGGFLGVGSRKIAVDWGALSFPPSGVIDHVIVNLTRDQVRLAPEYRPGEPVVVLGAAESVQQKPDHSPQPENPAPEK